MSGGQYSVSSQSRYLGPVVLALFSLISFVAMYGVNIVLAWNLKRRRC